MGIKPTDGSHKYFSFYLRALSEWADTHRSINWAEELWSSLGKVEALSMTHILYASSSELHVISNVLGRTSGVEVSLDIISAACPTNLT
jgi:hypothetical protein